VTLQILYKFIQHEERAILLSDYVVQREVNGRNQEFRAWHSSFSFRDNDMWGTPLKRELILDSLFHNAT
jgi:hypothetical protein